MKFFPLTSLSTLIVLLSTQIVFASCPSIDSIKAVGFNKILIYQDGWLARYERNKYDTNYEWTFTLQGNSSQVNNEDEARQKAMQELKSLTFVDGPIFVKSSPSYTMCIYKTNHSRADTRTPPLKNNYE